MNRRWLLGLALVATGLFCSCRSEDPPSREQIFQDEVSVDTLYLTEDGWEFTGPGNRYGAIVVPDTKELAWAAWQCNNPDCPGDRKGDRPFLFPIPDPFRYVKEDGTIGTRQPETEADFKLQEKYGEQVCPACLRTRNRSAETEQQRMEYQQYCQVYVLPEAEKRLEELEEQRRRLRKK